MPAAKTHAPATGIEPRLRYVFLLVAYLVGIYWLSSLPGSGAAGDSSALSPLMGGHPMLRHARNLAHIPLFAGLAFCLLHALSGGKGRPQITWRLAALTLLGIAALAALDEWHQSFVPGREPRIKDFFLDLLGGAGMLLVIHLRARRGARRKERFDSRLPRAQSVTDPR